MTDYQKPLIIDTGEIGKMIGGIWLGYVSDKIGSRVLLIPFCFAFATVDLYLMSFITKDQLYLLYGATLL